MLRKFYTNTAAILLIICAVLFIGVIQYFELPIGLYPRTTKPLVKVGVSTGHTSAKEFSERYLTTIDTAIRNVSGVDKVHSVMWNGYTEFNVEFGWSAEPDKAKTDLVSALGGVKNSLPQEWPTASVYFEDAESSMTYVSAYSEKHTMEELAELMNERVMPALARIPGVAYTQMTRFDEQRILVTADYVKLTEYGLFPGDLKRALTKGEFDRSLGQLSQSAFGKIPVEALLKDRTLEDLKTAHVGWVGNRAVRVQDVAKLEIENIVPERIFKGDGKRGVVLMMAPRPDANLKEVSQVFVDTALKVTRDLDPNIQVRSLLAPADFVVEAISNVKNQVGFAIFITTLVFFLFMGDLRNTLIIGVIIPLSLVGSFILMNFMSLEINLISLGAMALSVGMVVDGAIVVMENIYRHLEEKAPTGRAEKLDVILGAVAEVRISLLASFLTLFVVFLPLPFTSPLTSAILGDLAKVLICVQLIALTLTFFIIPPLILKFGRIPSRKRNSLLGLMFVSSVFQAFLRVLQRGYLWTLVKLLKFKTLATLLILAVAMGLFSSGYLIKEKIQKEIMAKPHTDKIFFVMRLKDGEYDLLETEQMIAPYEQEITELFSTELKGTLSSISKGNGWILLSLSDKNSLPSVKGKLEERFKSTARIDFHIEPWSPVELKIPNPPVALIDVLGKTDEEKRAVITSIQETLQSVEAVGNVQTSPIVFERSKLQLKLNHELLSNMRQQSRNVPSNEEILELISLLLKEQSVRKLSLLDKQLDIVLKTEEGVAKTVADLQNLLVRIDGKYVPLRHIAETEYVPVPGNYVSKDGELSYQVEVFASEAYSKRKVEAGQLVRDALSVEKSPHFSKLQFNDPNQEISENINSLVKALGLALLLIILVIVIQFGSVIQAGVIFLAIPLGFIGFAHSLYFFSSTVSVNSMLGLILLAGTAINNSIILVDFYNVQRKDPTLNPTQAILKAATIRFRPILITTLTTLLGTMPIALGAGTGGEVLRPLGIAVCGGLAVSTFLTLLVVPVALNFLEDMKNRLSVTREASALFVVLGLFWSALGEAQPLSLTLEEAERRALASHPTLTESRLGSELIELRQKSHWGQLLPSVSASQSLARGALKSWPGEQSVDIEQDTLSLSVTERLTDPHKWWLERSRLQTEGNLANNRVTQTEKKVLRDLRITYFQAKLAELRWQAARTSLEIAEQSAASAQQRFEQGLLDRLELDRTLLAQRQLDVQLKTVVSELAQHSQNLAYLVNASPEQVLNLVTPFPQTFQYFGLDDTRVLALTGLEDFLTIRESEILVERASIAEKLMFMQMFPSVALEVGASWSRVTPPQRMEQTLPLIKLTLSWDVFSGGRDLLAYRMSALEKQSSLIALQRVRDEQRLFIGNRLRELRILQERLETSLKNLELAEKIHRSSVQRFESGTVSAQQTGEDLRNLLNEQNELADIRVRIIVSLAELSALIGKDEVFKNLL